MTSTELIRSALIQSGKTQQEIADRVGWSKQNLSLHMKRNTVPFDMLTKILDICGFELSVKNSDGGNLLHYGNGAGERLRCVIGGKVYDTAKSSAVASTDDYCGTGNLAELHIDPSGAYFLACYDNQAKDGCIVPVDTDGAKELAHRWENRSKT